MSSDFAISANNLGKCYQLYAQPHDRLKQFLWRGKRQYYREFWALRDVNFEIMPGEVLGVIGRNGSGKSTLLQLVCGTLTPTVGEVSVKGRVAALLELGAGFNPEFSGRENVFLSASILGLSPQEITARFDDIIDFSGIRDFIDQPVKTYSSGMFIRLAFSVATSVDPDILVIDEALSVGDGAFARQSFDRIMALHDAGKTILFCSHSLYQVEALCNRVIWLNQGRIMEIGPPAQTIVAYNQFLSSNENDAKHSLHHSSETVLLPKGTARIINATVSCDGYSGKELLVRSRLSCIEIDVSFSFDPYLPVPSVAIVITDMDGRKITSAGTANDNFSLHPQTSGIHKVSLRYNNFALLKGYYWVYVFLMCERGIHVYESADMLAKLVIDQNDLEIGIVSLPHTWLDKNGKQS